MFDIYGCYFMYGDFNSEEFDLVFGNMDTSRIMALEASKNINNVRSRKHNVYYANRVSYTDEPISFEAEIFTKDITPIMVDDLPIIERALFNRNSYTKLYQIMLHERDSVYINCILTNPEKIENMSGVVGYKFVVNMDSVMAWEETNTQESTVESTSTTLTGDIVSFTEDKEYKLKQLTIDIDHTQDLHGYTSPWVGGTGKNLLPLIDGTYSLGSTGASCVISNGEINVTGTTTSSGGRTTRLSEYFTLPAGTYIISPVQNTSPYIRGYINKKTDDTAIGYSTGSAITISEDTEVYYGIGVESDQTYSATIYPQVESGSEVTSYAPYENICPITGQIESNVTMTGKNILSPTIYNGGVYNPSIGATFNLSVAEDAKQLTEDESRSTFTVNATANNQTFTLLVPLKYQNPVYINIGISGDTDLRTSRLHLDKNYKVLSRVNNTSRTQTISGEINIAENDAYYAIVITNSTATTETITITNPMASLGDEEVPYEPYNGKIYSTSLNLWDEEYVNGYFSTTGQWNSGSVVGSKNPIIVKPNTTYYLHIGSNDNTYITYWTQAVPSGETDTEHFISRSSALKNTTFTTPATCNAIHINIGSGYGETYKHDVSINFPKNETRYISYAGSERTTEVLNTFGNTVYGGTLNVVTGVLTMTYWGKIFDGTETWTQAGSAGSSKRYYATWETLGLDREITSVSSTICSHATYLSGNSGDWGTFNSTTTLYAVHDENNVIGSSSNFATYCAEQLANGTPYTVVVKLATPKTYQLTQQQVTSLVGQNSLWSDTGEITISYDQTNDFHIDVDTDLNDYIYPDVEIQVGSDGGDIVIYNATDDATRFTEFSSVPPLTTFTMKGSINHITNNMYNYFTSRNFIRLVNGRNNFFMYGDIERITFRFNNRKFM